MGWACSLNGLGLHYKVDPYSESIASLQSEALTMVAKDALEILCAVAVLAAGSLNS